MVQHRGHVIERTLNGWTATVYLHNEGRFTLVKADNIHDVRHEIDKELEKDNE